MTLGARIAALGYRSYRAYLASPHWRDVRERWHREHPLAGCAVCGLGGPLELHHRTYARLGRERASDLEALCRWCHHDVERLIALGLATRRGAAGHLRRQHAEQEALVAT